MEAIIVRCPLQRRFNSTQSFFKTFMNESAPFQASDWIVLLPEVVMQERIGVCVSLSM